MTQAAIRAAAKAKMQVLFGGRLIATLEDNDGNVFYPHGAVIAPLSMTTEAEVRDAITQAHQKAVDANPEEWNYDDVIDNLEAAGFSHFSPIRWIE